MKKNQVELKQIYIVKVSGAETKVRLDAESPHGGWVGTNLATGRQVRIRTAAKLRRVALTKAQEQEADRILERIVAKDEVPDVSVRNEGSVFAFTPRTAAGRAWIDENVASAGWQWMGPALVVEARLAPELARGMQDAGLKVV